MTEFLVEIGTEDLPSEAVDIATNFAKEFFSAELNTLGLSHGQVQTYGTPRRIVLHIDKIDCEQKSYETQITGPSKSLAFDGEKLTKVGLGFIKAKGISKDDIYFEETPKGPVIAAKVKIVGEKTKNILPSLVEEFLAKIPFKKRMRWCASTEAFSRPIRWMVGLFGEDKLVFSYADVTSSNHSFGHRFLAPEQFLVTSVKQYFMEMEKRFVLLDKNLRLEKIRSWAQRLAQEAGGALLEDDETLEMVKNLVEYPFVILGSFPKKYLELPKELIHSEMRTHQKCFAVKDSEQLLKPNFIFVAGTKPFDEQKFADGNAIVLKARFEDGAFYFERDKNVGLTRLADNLENLIFEHKLGSVHNKVERMQIIGKYLASEMTVDAQEVNRAIKLAKADLVSGVVGEFPELQGIMGGIYAHFQNESQKVCEAIKEHYQPKFSSDRLPSSALGALVSLADRVDTLVGIIGEKGVPKGNKDPFALRRHAISLTRLLVEFAGNVNLSDLLLAAVKSYKEVSGFDFSHKISNIKAFIEQRAKVFLAETLEGDNKVSLAEAVFSSNHSNLLEVFAKSHALNQFKKLHEKEFFELIQTFKRAGNLVKKNVVDESKVKESLLSSNEERALVQAIKEVRSFLKDQKKVFDFKNACSFYQDLFSKIAQVKPKLDAFFEHHMVMDDDANIKNSRLWLLNNIQQIAIHLADFTHL